MSSLTVVATLLPIINGKFWRSEDGQDLVEYGLLVALIAVVAIGAVSVLGQTIYTVFWKTIQTNF
jgi:pilus assembly protein Flp/PilA